MPQKKIDKEGLADVLIEKFDKYGAEKRAQSIVAAELGISQSRLSQIISEVGLMSKTILVPRPSKRDGGDGHNSDGQLSFLG